MYITGHEDVFEVESTSLSLSLSLSFSSFSLPLSLSVRPSLIARHFPSEKSAIQSGGLYEYFSIFFTISHNGSPSAFPSAVLQLLFGMIALVAGTIYSDDTRELCVSPTSESLRVEAPCCICH